MDLQLRGKRAVVSGSTGGIGFAIARALFDEGASVVVNGRGPKRVDEAVAKIRGGAATGAGGDVRGVAADLGTAAGCAALFREVPDADIVVNNLGIFEPKPFGRSPTRTGCASSRSTSSPASASRGRTSPG
jgi:NAD(P)-dependent dehydrogenase (short-subunit alcohol dehydrogenase family)